MKLVFASSNPGKIAEIRQMLPPTIELLGLTDIGCFEDIPETAETIEGNAILKADYVTRNYGYDCFADDSGLEVHALGGEPGVKSARYSGEARSSSDNIDLLLKKLEGQSNRSARFVTTISLNLQGNRHIFTGYCKGTITQRRIGDGGFGYDPVFMPDGYSQTFAQLSSEEKNRIGHRGIAFRNLLAFLQK